MDFIDSVIWQKKPWDDVDNEEVPWEYFTGSQGLDPALGTPGFGNWAIRPVVHFLGGGFAMLQEPEQRAVAKIVSVTWKPWDYGDEQQSHFEGAAGDKFFAERRGIAPDAALHDVILVEVNIDWGEGDFGGLVATVYLQAFDPDHASSDIDFDTNDVSPNDNIVAGDVAGELNYATLTFEPGETSKTTIFTVHARQPGNNFIVAASGRQDLLNAILFKQDGTTLIKKTGGADVPNHLQTKVLTVWRTLWVEEESMGAPDPPDPADPAEFDGAAAGGNDDFDPGDLGGATGVGDFVQPSLALLTSQLQRANVEVVKVVSETVDISHAAPFVHNLDNVDYPIDEGVRDVDSEADRWAVLAFAAYEWSSDEDFDPDFTEGIAGITRGNPQAPMNIFLETIRDITQNASWIVDGVEIPTVDAERMRQRTVLHEAMHRFGHDEHDVGVMDSVNGDPPTEWYGSDAEVELTGTMLREIMLTNKP